MWVPAPLPCKGVAGWGWGRGWGWRWGRGVGAGCGVVGNGCCAFGRCWWCWHEALLDHMLHAAYLPTRCYMRDNNFNLNKSTTTARPGPTTLLRSLHLSLLPAKPQVFHVTLELFDGRRTSSSSCPPGTSRSTRPQTLRNPSCRRRRPRSAGWKPVVAVKRRSVTCGEQMGHTPQGPTARPHNNRVLSIAMSWRDHLRGRSGTLLPATITTLPPFPYIPVAFSDDVHTQHSPPLDL